MEILMPVISIAFLLGLILVPILLCIGLKKWNLVKYGFLAYLTFGLILTAGLMWTFAWWTDYSDQLLMHYYGYDFDAINDTERYLNVKSENLIKVKQLEIGYFGMGWPLNAILSFVLYSPYLLIVYGVGQWIKKA